MPLAFISLHSAYAGLDNGDIARIVDCSERAAERHWRDARAWLKRELSKSDHEE